MPYYDPNVTGSTLCRVSLTKGSYMESQIDTDVHTDVELVTETLVEEVSIDGMCGVY